MIKNSESKKKCWSDINENFNKELQEKWEQEGFNYEQTKELSIVLEDSFEYDDYDFYSWLRDVKKLTVHLIKDLNIKKLKREYNDEMPYEEYRIEHFNLSWKKEGFSDQEIKNWYRFGIGIENYKLATHLRENGYNPQTAFINKSPAQTWLDWKYPQEMRKEVKEISIRIENLAGSLKIESWPNLDKINCGSSKLTSLTVINCPRLKIIEVVDNDISNFNIVNCPEINYLNLIKNKLIDLNFLNNLNKEKILSFNIGKNNFFSQNLDCFSQLTNVWNLTISDNSFFGSLKPLKDLEKLTTLRIENNNLVDGLEYLPENLEWITCNGQLAEDLKKHKNEIRYDYQSWRKKNLNLINKAQSEQIKELKKENKELDKKFKNCENHISKLNEKIEEFADELISIKRKELDLTKQEIKDKLDEKFWGYLDILLLIPETSEASKKAQKNLINQVSGNELQKILLLQHEINHLEKYQEFNSQIEILPPYN